jgi:hypothetical protein
MLASIMDVLLEAGLGALAFLDNGIGLHWLVGWPLFWFQTNQVQHELDSLFHRLALRRQVLLFLHQFL